MRAHDLIAAGIVAAAAASSWASVRRIRELHRRLLDDRVRHAEERLRMLEAMAPEVREQALRSEMEVEALERAWSLPARPGRGDEGAA